MLKLKLQYFGHLMWRADSLEKTLMLGGIRGRRRRGRQRMSWLDGITNSMGMSLVNSGSWWWTGKPGVLWFMGSKRIGHDWVTELNWMCILNMTFPEEMFSVWIHTTGDSHIKKLFNFRIVLDLQKNCKDSIVSTYSTPSFPYYWCLMVHLFQLTGQYWYIIIN